MDVSTAALYHLDGDPGVCAPVMPDTSGQVNATSAATATLPAHDPDTPFPARSAPPRRRDHVDPADDHHHDNDHHAAAHHHHHDHDPAANNNNNDDHHDLRHHHDHDDAAAHHHHHDDHDPAAHHHHDDHAATHHHHDDDAPANDNDDVDDHHHDDAPAHHHDDHGPATSGGQGGLQRHDPLAGVRHAARPARGRVANGRVRGRRRERRAPRCAQRHGQPGRERPQRRRLPRRLPVRRREALREQPQLRRRTDHREPGHGRPQPTGRLCIYTSATTPLIVDLLGWGAATGQSYTTTTPERLYDTRPNRLAAGGTGVVQVTGRAGIPAGATAAAVNLTVVAPVTGGFLTAYPCGQARPVASNVNYAAGQTITNLAAVALSGSGSLCVYTSAQAAVIVDVTGWWGSGGSLKFVVGPAASRLVDTRPSALPAGVTVPVLVPAGSVAVINLTAVGAQAAGFFTAWPCGQPRPGTSNLNYEPGKVVAGAALVAQARAGTCACSPRPPSTFSSTSSP